MQSTIFYSLLARALNVSSKVIAFMLSVAKIASLSAIEVSSVELGTWKYENVLNLPVALT